MQLSTYRIPKNVTLLQSILWTKHSLKWSLVYVISHALRNVNMIILDSLFNSKGYEVTLGNLRFSNFVFSSFEVTFMWLTFLSYMRFLKMLHYLETTLKPNIPKCYSIIGEFVNFLIFFWFKINCFLILKIGK